MLDYVKVDHEADPYSVAYTIALNALVARAKSKGELVAHLKKRGIEDEVAAATIFRLQEAGLINDEEFARAWTQSRHNSKKLSKRIIAGELRTRGVDQNSIDAALDEIDDEDEYKMAMTLAERKFRSCSHLDHDVIYRRVHGLLSRKGFSHSISGRIMRELLGSNDR